MAQGASARLQVGGDPNPDWEYLPLDRLSAAEGRYSQISLAPPIDALGDLWPVFRRCRELCEPGARLVVRRGPPGRISERDVLNLLELCGFGAGKGNGGSSGGSLESTAVPVSSEPLSCTVVVPCRNEAGNVLDLVRRIPDIGTHTEILFVDGSSTDGTPELVLKEIAAHPERDIKLLRQENPQGGKAAAVFQGFDAASCDVVMILDADMTVAPEDLPRFFLAVAEGACDFANGSRFVYPMERGAMHLVNNAGNRAFSIYLSWLLGSPIADTLCGTKAMRRSDWHRIESSRHLFGGHDPWGDFDLLLGAGYTDLQILDVPIVYGARTSGESKMRPFAHGFDLAKTCLAGLKVLRFSGSRASNHE